MIILTLMRHLWLAQGGDGTANHFFCRSNHPLMSLFIRHRATIVPHSIPLHSQLSPVKRHQQGGFAAYSTLGALGSGASAVLFLTSCICHPWQDLRDVDPRKED